MLRFITGSSFRQACVLAALPLLFSGCFQTREEIAKQKEDQEVRSNLQQNVMENGQTMEKMQADIGRLQGRLDEVEHQRKKDMTGFASSQENQQKQLAESLAELKTRVTALQEAQNALFEEVKKMREDSLAAPARIAPAKKKGAARAATSAASGFDGSLTAYKARDYSAAIGGFRAYLEASPKAKRALDAHYFLGDSLFKEKQYEEAVAEFGTVQEKAPATFYGRRSALRLAQSFKALGKIKDAKAFADLLVQQSPDSEEAKTARKMFK